MSARVPSLGSVKMFAIPSGAGKAELSPLWITEETTVTTTLGALDFSEFAASTVSMPIWDVASVAAVLPQKMAFPTVVFPLL